MGLASKVSASSSAGGAPAPQQGPGGPPPQQQQQGWGGPPAYLQQPPQQQAGGFYPQIGVPQGGQSAYPPIPGGYGGGAPAPYGQPQQPYPAYPQNPQWGAPPPGQGYPPQQQPPPYGAPQQPAPYGNQQAQQFGVPPPQQWGAQPQQQQPGADVAPLVANKINSIIATNRLQAFYPPQRVQQVLARLAGVDFRSLANQWRMNLELAIDLASLALYDVVIYADDSTSMKYADNGERIDDLKLILQRVSEVATLFDDDGISIRAMNANVVGDNIRTASQADKFVANLRFSGMTPLGTQMEKRILDPMLFKPIKNRSLPKPLLVVTITDGEPTNEPENKVYHVIKNAKKITSASQYGSGAVAFQFAQVGKDQEAQAFLGRLDVDKDIGAMVDCTSYYEQESEEYARKGVTLTPELWLVKLMCGAIDPSYDEQDE